MSEAKYLGLTANQLAKVASDLETENSELREQGARLFDKTLELGTENAKLRELCTALYKCRDKVSECWTCEDVACPLMDDCRLHARMRELGIEVD